MIEIKLFVKWEFTLGKRLALVDVAAWFHALGECQQCELRPQH